MTTHKTSLLKRVALVVLDIADNAPGVPLPMNTLISSSSCTTLRKEKKFASCTAPPQSWFRCELKGHESDTLNAVQLDKAP